MMMLRKKNVGILTLPFNNNYGGFLQAYALLSVLKKMGFNAEIISRRHNRKSRSWFVKKLAKNLIKKILGRSPVFVIPNPEKTLLFKGAEMMSFVKKYVVPQTQPFFSSRELERNCNGRYDVYLAGSDQLWRPDYVSEIENYFFSFVKDDAAKLISYAASFGVDDPCYTETQKKECGRLIARFSAVSVREKSGIDVIKKMGWKTQFPPEQVLDPTLLLGQEHYSSLIADMPRNQEKNVFCYILDGGEKLNKIADAVCNEMKASKKMIIDPYHWQEEAYILPPVEQWLSGFRDASFVVTDSFHGMVFSIIYKKAFVVYVNKERGCDRFYTLLDCLDLRNRIITDAENVKDVVRNAIDWSRVNELLEKRKIDSLFFLKEALDK